MSTNVTTMDLPLVSHDQGERVAVALEQIAALQAGGAVKPTSFENLKLVIQLGLGPSVLPVGTKIPLRRHQERQPQVLPQPQWMQTSLLKKWVSLPKASTNSHSTDPYGILAIQQCLMSCLNTASRLQALLQQMIR